MTRHPSIPSGLQTTAMASVGLPILIAIATPEPAVILGIYNTLTNLTEEIVFFALNAVVYAMFGILGDLFTGMLNVFLFPPNPRSIAGIAPLWDKATFAFFGIITVTGFGYFLTMMIFPYNEQSDPFRYFNRLFAAFIALGAGEYLLDLTWQAVTVLGQYIYPNVYTVALAGNLSLDLVADAGLGFIAFLVGLVLLFTISFLTIVTVFAVLAIRALLLYAIYALFPVFIALWVVDVGPFSNAKMVADLAFKGFAILLAVGILVSAILATSGAISGATDNPTIYNGNNDESMRDVYNNATGGDSGASAQSQDKRNGTTIKVMAFFGGLWAVFAILTSSLGMLVSVRGAGAGGGGGSASGAGGGGNAANNQSNAGADDGPDTSLSSTETVGRNISNDGPGMGKRALGAAKTGAKKFDSAAEATANMGNKSLAQGGKDAYGKAKSGYRAARDAKSDIESVGDVSGFSEGMGSGGNGNGASEMSDPPGGDGESSSDTMDDPPDPDSVDASSSAESSSSGGRTSSDNLNDFDDPEKWDGENFDAENATYHDSNDDLADQMHQKGTLEDTNGNTRPYVSFKNSGGDNPPTLEDGETYDLNNAQGRSYGANQPHAHKPNNIQTDSKGNYNQVHGTSQTTANKVSDDSGSKTK